MNNVYNGFEDVKNKILNAANVASDYFVLVMSNVRTWKPLYRKIYLLTLPISMPLLFLVRVLLFIVVTVFIVCILLPIFLVWGGIEWIYETWRGIPSEKDKNSND